LNLPEKFRLGQMECVAGANYLVEKPFSFDQLKRVVDKVTAYSISLQDSSDRGLAKLQLTKREEDVARRSSQD